QIDYRDPVGNFLIEVFGDKIIVVLQTTPGSGEVVAKYSGKNPLLLLREICSAVPTIRPDHAGYLGLELQKAFDSIRTGKAYAQDK
ncbi:MAG TPA: thymidylate synthase, partial [Cyanobacteria bacterium UBA11368]|nr:thymidylate synthase [Cyanobacteria bacterium UBA11368]